MPHLAAILRRRSDKCDMREREARVKAAQRRRVAPKGSLKGSVRDIRVVPVQRQGVTEQRQRHVALGAPMCCVESLTRASRATWESSALPLDGPVARGLYAA
jgi:hypothetical protein